MNCNSSKGKCLDEFTRKKVSILAKTVKNLIFMDFCVVHPYSCDDCEAAFTLKRDLRARYVTSQNPTAMARHLELSYGVRNTINPLLDKQDQVTKTKMLWGLIMTL